MEKQTSIHLKEIRREREMNARQIKRDVFQKRNAMSPQFQLQGALLLYIQKAYPQLMMNQISPSKKANKRAAPNRKFTAELSKYLVSSNAKEFRSLYGQYVEKFGGHYNPGFTYDNIFDNHQSPGWKRFLGIIMQTPTTENALSTIKRLKAKKNLINSIISNKNKELLMNNESVMKCYAYEQFVRNNKNISEFPNDLSSEKVISPLASNTQNIIVNVLNDKKFMIDLKAKEQRLLKLKKVSPLKDQNSQLVTEDKIYNKTELSTYASQSRNIAADNKLRRRKDVRSSIKRILTFHNTSFKSNVLNKSSSKILTDMPSFTTANSNAFPFENSGNISQLNRKTEQRSRSLSDTDSDQEEDRFSLPKATKNGVRNLWQNSEIKSETGESDNSSCKGSIRRKFNENTTVNRYLSPTLK